MLNLVGTASQFQVVEHDAVIHFGSNGVRAALSIDGSTVTLVAVGPWDYIEAPDSYLRSQLSAKDRALFRPSRAAWIKTTPSQLENLTDQGYQLRLMDVIETLQEANTASQFVAAGTETVNGVEAVRLKYVEPGESSPASFIDIAAAGPAYPLRWTLAGHPDSTLTLSDWGSPYLVQTPPEADTVPYSAVLPTGS
jgi:hypothetical protein